MVLNREETLILLVDCQEKLMPLILNHTSVIKACRWLIQLAMRLSVPCIVTEQYPAGLGHTLLPLMSSHIKTVIEKETFSCWGEPLFQEALKLAGKHKILLSGIETHVCILQTALDLKVMGYEVYIVVDAIGSRVLSDHDVALKRMKQAGIIPVTREMVLFEWLKTAKAPEFKSVSQAFLKQDGEFFDGH